MQQTNIHLSRTDPVTGATEAADWGREFTEVDGVVLVVKHTYRGATRHQFWRAEAYTDHIAAAGFQEWAQAGHGFGFAHVRRKLLLRQIADLVGTEEWAAKRAAWLAAPAVVGNLSRRQPGHPPVVAGAEHPESRHRTRAVPQPSRRTRRPSLNP
ncbi:hypothetical protein ACIQF6_28865 [Kitasatospora sp. NPDC092948]|uniref:hypothetical protein n=1 Tax=Kitasatospora sp. NPDC092948 TaxID=3364088 RepID=UPI003808A840